MSHAETKVQDCYNTRFNGKLIDSRDIFSDDQISCIEQ